MPTPRLTDRQRAERAAERAFLQWVYGPPEREADLHDRAVRHLTIVAHWDGDEDGECTCAQCWLPPADDVRPTIRARRRARN